MIDREGEDSQTFRDNFNRPISQTESSLLVLVHHPSKIGFCGGPVGSIEDHTYVIDHFGLHLFAWYIGLGILLQVKLAPLTGNSSKDCQTGCTQTLIIHVIRTNKIPFIQSRASWPLIFTSIIIVKVGSWLTISPLASTLGFVPLPPTYWLYLAGLLMGYVALTQIVKTWFYRRFGT